MSIWVTRFIGGLLSRPMAVVAVNPSLAHLTRTPHFHEAGGLQFMTFDANLSFGSPIQFRVYLHRGESDVGKDKYGHSGQEETLSHGCTPCIHDACQTKMGLAENLLRIELRIEAPSQRPVYTDEYYVTYVDVKVL